ncbi:TPA: hypothetical protein ACH3X2_009213 [Trebouxia sp. C0005]
MQFEPAQLALQPCSWQACIACVCSSIPTAMNETDTGASAPFVSSQQAQPLQRAQLADASSARAAGINAIPATTTDNTPQEGYDFWHPPQYQPAESSQADLQLSPWETATVFDSGLQPHPGRAHLDTGNSSCTLITSRFAKQLGLVNFDCRPTQAYSGTIRVSGIVHGMHIDLPIINIQYEIQGTSKPFVQRCALHSMVATARLHACHRYQLGSCVLAGKCV